MAYERQYTQGVGWENEPSINTPISAENLNQMDMAIQDVDEAAYNAFNNIESKQRNRFRHAVMTNSGSVIALQCGTIVDTYNSIDDLHDGDILVLYVSNAISLSSGSTWKVQAYKKVDASSTVSILKELRDANGANITSNFSAGSLLFMLYDATNNYWKLQEIIESGSGGGARVFSDHITSQDSTNLITSTSVFGGDTPQEGDIIFLKCDVNATWPNPPLPLPGWGIVFGSGGSGSSITDARNGSESAFTSDISSGTTLIVSKSSSGYWALRALIPVAGGGGSSTLAGLTDTNITNPVDGQALKYNNTAGKWENATGNNYSDIITSGTQQLLMVSEESDIFYDGLMTPGNMLFLRASVDCEFESGAYPSFNGWLLAWEDEDGLLMGSPIYDRRDAEQGPIPFAEDISADTLLVFTVSNNNYLSLVALIPAGGGGGGTTVIANPSDPASSDLEKLQVGNTIYAINAGNSAEGNKITSTSRTGQDKLVTNIQLDSGIAEHEGDVFYLTSELDTGESQYGWNVQLQYAVGEGGYADIYIPLFGMNPSTVMDIFSGNIAAGDILVVKVTHSGIVQSYAMYILAYISASGGGASTLADLTDTDISSPADGQVLMYNGTEWENADIPAPAVATSAAVGVVKPDNETITIDNDGTIHGQEIVPVGAGYWTISNGKATWVGGEITGSWTVANGKATWVPAS